MVANGNDVGTVCSGRQNITVVNIAPSDDVGQPYSGFKDQPYANVSQTFTNGGQTYANKDQLYSNVSQTYANDDRPYSNVSQTYAKVGRTYTNLGETYASDEQLYKNVTQAFAKNGQHYVNVDQLYEDIDPRFEDVDRSFELKPNVSLSRQRHEPLQILDVDLEDYLEKHGCIIQRTFVNLPLDLNSIGNESYGGESDEEEVETFGDKPGNCHDDIITEQRAAITLQNEDLLAKAQNAVTVNKGFIVDQNVGVTGEVSMVHPNRPTNQANEFVTNSSGKKSPTVVYIGTIEEIDEDTLIKQVDVLETIEENESGPSSITLSFYETSPEVVRKNGPIARKSDVDPKIVAEERDEKVEKASLPAPALLMQWRVRPPPDSEDVRREEAESPVTPSSSMFSSAYTVTELGSDNSSDHSPPSESSTSTMSSRRASERGNGLGSQDDCYLKFQEYLQLFRQLSAFNNALLFEDSSEVHSYPSSSENGVLERESRSGSSRSIVFNYIPSRDQREKEEEELWVANEAAYSNPGELGEEENKFVDAIPKKTSQVVPAVNFIISHDISETKDKSTSTSFTTSQENTKDKSTVQMATSSTQTVYSCLLPSSYYSVPRRYNQRSSASDRESAGSDDGSSELPSVSSETLLREGGSDSASRMATLLCSVNTAERRHFSARQRIVEPEIVKVEQTVKRASTSGSVVGNNKEIKSAADAKSCPVTSAATNQPTKRFSFLIRSNSMEQKDKMPNPSVSASDKAILAKLAELKLDDIKENTNQKKTTSSPQSLHPPCRRCHQPVYPQERIQTSREILFHASCFKCYQCGARLNLKTFYRNPLTLRDHRIFCKSHVPAMDPGKVFQECKTLGVLPKAETTPTVTTCRSSLVSTAQSNGERVVVKGDTQGLRYF